jgi:hypothetical protein
LAKLIVTELVHYRNWKVVQSRPCLYGVFSGPVGGFAPRPKLCVGCLRCTTQFPDFVKILKNPERQKLGDSFISPDQVDTILYETSTGTVPVRGAGYRGKFGGKGWDGMWTDMSEIVRPTRDGIHGREYISTEVDIGEKPMSLSFDTEGNPTGELPRTFSIGIPMIFDVPPASVQTQQYFSILQSAASHVQTLVVVPIKKMLVYRLPSESVVPLVAPAEQNELKKLSISPTLMEMASWDEGLFEAIHETHPTSLVALRVEYGEDLLKYIERGVKNFHLVASYHGQTRDGKFVLDAIRDMHDLLVKAGVREEVTLLGSGGVAAAEHVPKAIICGLDAVALDVPLLIALQAKLRGDCVNVSSQVELPKNLPSDWATQRIKNLAASWRDQLLEILGAMGMREVRRLRGEIGRAMFQSQLEHEAFAGIEGYHG